MTVEQADIRKLCTDAVFERGENYYAEGRIRDCTRVGETVTATVQGSRLYELTLSLADEVPPDTGEQIDAVLADVDDDDLRAFVRDELAQDSAMLERFLARFGTGQGKSYTEYRRDVEQLFEEHTDQYPVVVDAIDFSQFTEIGEKYQNRGQFRHAAAVYRGLVAGIDDNIHLVDAAYDHYAKVFRAGLDAYVECVKAADLDHGERETYESFLVERVETGSGVHREQFQRALSNLQTATET